MGNKYIENYEESLRLFYTLLKNTSEDITETKIFLNAIEKFINKDFIEFAREYSPANNAELFYNFLYEFERFSEFVEFPKLAGKNIIGLGGSFSSGKSSFLNAYTKRKILPVQITPTTSIPTYLIGGGEENIGGINIFSKKVKLDADALKALTHDLGSMIFGNLMSDSDTLQESVSLSYILKLMFVELTEIKYMNIAFLDTPGYSKPDSETYEKNTDEKLAKAQLNSCNNIIWFVDAEGGTIKDEDIKFLEEIDKNIPILIIISKADKKQDDIKDIVEFTRKTSREKGLNVIDVVPFSSRKTDMFPVSAIDKYLDIWDEEKSDILFARNFKKIFTEFEDYFDNELSIERKRLNKLNSMEVLIENYEEVDEYLKHLQSETKQKIKILEERKETLKKMKNEFFTGIKNIGDRVGIPLPEPKDIDMIKDRIVSPFKLLKEYKQKKNIPDNGYDVIIADMMKDEINIFSKYKKTSDEFEEIIKNSFEDIPVSKKFTDFGE